MELYCKNCWNFGRCSAVGRTVTFAVNHGVCRDFDEVKPLTNAQKIRAMSDEDLADLFSKTRNCPPSFKNIDECIGCFECWCKYLKRPVEEETNDAT